MNSRFVFAVFLIMIFCVGVHARIMSERRTDCGVVNTRSGLVRSHCA